MKKKKAKRERAAINVRIYPSTLEKLHEVCFKRGWTIALTIDEAIRMAAEKWEAGRTP